MNHVKQYNKKRDSTDADEGVVPERPELAEPTTAQDLLGETITPAARRAREEALEAQERDGKRTKEDEEEGFVMNAELEALEQKIQHAEQRLAKWERKYERQLDKARRKGREPKISEGEYAREKSHIERVLRKLYKTQQELWAKEELPQ